MEMRPTQRMKNMLRVSLVNAGNLFKVLCNVVLSIIPVTPLLNKRPIQAPYIHYWLKISIYDFGRWWLSSNLTHRFMMDQISLACVFIKSFFYFTRNFI